ncbi:hypothetical protein [Streptomyces cavernicola]|uniref:Secreted protein n=1 Tax=Streptomyces cavernicola TaxID=3043613 RepID=A0ABT6S8C1_9ACTN|nr:hypothetical protein [Streptomyces sp. B-S-A6]MDI3404358.1 hypothetical protein [Streptomyces sp. B-S-A6]
MRQRGLVHGLAWTLATGAAVTLSWWGVHTVMSGTAYDRPRALPLTGAAQASPESAAPQASSTHRPRETPKLEGSGEQSEKPTEPTGPTGTPPAKDSPSGSAPAPEPQGNVKSYTVSGGRVAFEMRPSSAELVSATPEAGWQMQVWKQPEWIRVTFTQGDREVSVFCTWHDHKPLVELDER